MPFKAAIDSNGVPVYIGRDENRLTKLAANYTIVDTVPPRGGQDARRRWIYVNGLWEIDVASETAAEQAEAQRLQEIQDSTQLIKDALDDPNYNWNSGVNLRGLIQALARLTVRGV